MTISVTCLVTPDNQQVLDLLLENADGQTSSVCDLPPDTPGTNRVVYNLAPGDSIYSVQACYNGGSMVGVTFSSAGGPLVCGNPQDPEARCRSTTVTTPSPMAAINGQCSGEGIVELTRVCFNPFFVNPTVPITGMLLERSVVTRGCGLIQPAHSSSSRLRKLRLQGFMTTCK